MLQSRSPIMNLLLVRHGESVANTEGRMQGHFDSPLSERGKEQAHALAARLLREGHAVSAIYSSDLCRASETAQILARSLGAPVILDARLREYDVGVLTGVVWSDVEFLYPELWREMHQSDTWVEFPGQEGRGPFRDRVAAALADTLGRHGTGDTVAVVSHGGSIGILLADLLGIDIQRPLPFRFSNASLSIVEVGGRRPRLSLLNDTCHLDRELS